jgi:hypothetical protein
MAMIQAKQVEPPSWLRLPLFMLGQDLRGNWVVQEQRGARGGLFVDREAALRFIRAETARKQQAIVMVSGILELDTGYKGDTATPSDDAADSRPLRRTA